MKNFRLLPILLTITSIVVAAPPHRIELTLRNNLPTFSADTITAVPGLYVHYPQAKFQLLTFSSTFKAGETLSQAVYLPADVEAIEPVIAYVDKRGTQHYSYCKDTINLPQLTAAAASSRLEVKYSEKLSTTTATDKALTCSYQTIAVKKSSE